MHIEKHNYVDVKKIRLGFIQLAAFYLHLYRGAYHIISQKEEIRQLQSRVTCQDVGSDVGIAIQDSY